MELISQPLTKEAFAPFGDVIDVPDTAGRTYYEDALGNLRDTAHASLSVSMKAETADRPLRSDYMERHEFSSQTFMPLDVSRYLIVVAPHAATGGPDVDGMKAFIATGKQASPTGPTPGITASPCSTGPAASPSSCGATAARATRSSSRCRPSPSSIP
jgi:ureidoglycolate lyase